jgi:serine/threonine protein phosphatase PrpC
MMALRGLLGQAAAAACEALAAPALNNGGKDNVTVVLARCRFPEAAA